MSTSFEGEPGLEKGLPPLPTMLDALAIHTKSLRMQDGQTGTPPGSVNSRRSNKSRRKMNEAKPDHRPSPPTLSTDITPPYSSQGSPATPMPTRGPPFTPVSLDSTRSFAVGYDPKNLFGAAYTPSSPSAASRHSMSTSTTTPKSSNKFSFGTKSSSKSTAPSVHSSHTMPEMIAYNDVDQWGALRKPASPSCKVSDGPSSGSGLRPKNSSSKLLASGLSRSLTRMGSVMKRSTSDNALSSSKSSRKEKWMKKRSRHFTVAEEMGDGWERVDMHREVTEGDTSITRPFNVEHDLHVSPDLGDLPPAWLDTLKAQGLSEADLLLIATARHKAAQRPLLRIEKGSTPPANGLPTSKGPQPSHARGMSTPTYPVNADEGHKEKPLLNKRFSWEKDKSSPAKPAPVPDDEAEATERPISPFRAFRQSLQDSPISAQTPTRAESSQCASDDDRPENETPRKTKRWSDQLRGFQNTFSTFGGDDDWGSQLTLALGGESGLQTVHEVDSGRGESMETTRSDPLKDPTVDVLPDMSEDTADQTTSRSSRKNPKSLSINASTPTKPARSLSHLSPLSPGGTRIRRKPVPSNVVVGRPNLRRASSSGLPSVPSSPAERPWPHSPPPPRRDKPSTPRARETPNRDLASSQVSSAVSSPPSSYPHSHSHSLTQSVSQSNESELEQDVRTPSTNQHFFHTPSSSFSHPTLPRSISEENQITSFAFLKSQQLLATHSEGRNNAEVDAGLSTFSFPSKTPPRPNPRHSVPASAGYTESTPPSRGATPSCGESESEDPHPATAPVPAPTPAHAHADASATTPVGSKGAGTQPSTPPRAKRSSSRRTKPGSSPSSASRVDPMSRLDSANTMAERASIALSLISAESDVRSSMASSARSSYLNEAKVLRAFTRDLSGVEEGTSEREGTSDTDSNQQHGSTESNADAGVQGSDCAVATATPESQPAGARRSSPHSSTSAHGSIRSSRRQRFSPRKTPPAPPPIRPHPFASRKDSTPGYETDDDPLLALEAAARQIAKRTEAYYTLSHQRRESGQGRYSDAEE